MRLRFAAVGVALAAVLAACGANGSTSDTSSSNDDPDRVPLSQVTAAPDPKAIEGPSTASLAQHAITPVASDPAQSLPTTVVSHDRDRDVDVTVTDTSRVVALSLSGSLAATVHGLGFGDSLVGRDQSTNFPGTEDLPVLTSGGHSVNAEAVLAVKPTLIITDGTIGPRDVVEQLRDTGVPVVFLDDVPSFEGAQDLAREVAAVFGAPEVGDQLAQQIGDEVAETKAQIARLAPTDEADRLSMLFLYIRGGSGVYYLFGEESGADQLIDGLRGVDVAGKLGWTGMRPLTDEAMVKADPDVILVMTDGLESAGGIDGLLAQKPAIALTTAGKNRRFVDMADADILSFGPRSAEVLDALARAIYAPQSDS